MSKHVETAEHQEMVARLKEVRAAAIAAMQRTVELARQRRRIIDELLAEGFSQADLARELGVTRQAISKHLRVMAAAGLVRGTRHGRESVWQLEPRRLDEARRFLELISEGWDAALGRLRKLVEE